MPMASFVKFCTRQIIYGNLRACRDILDRKTPPTLWKRFEKALFPFLFFLKGTKDRVITGKTKFLANKKLCESVKRLGCIAVFMIVLLIMDGFYDSHD